jgi:hypothetical protein
MGIASDPATNNYIRISQNNPGAGPPPPHRGESFFAIAKSLMVRALIIYFITSMFRRPSVPVEKAGGIPQSVKTASTQIYANGTTFVCGFFHSPIHLQLV